jgi:hypothetical protein
MQDTPTNMTQQKKNLRGWFFLWGSLAGLMVAVLCAAVVLGVVLLRERAKKSAAVNEPPDAFVQLSVSADGCGVTRSDVSGLIAVDALTWVIADDDGFPVLERNTENEFQYRYFIAGEYTVSIKAWYGGRYYTISNVVEIDC